MHSLQPLVDARAVLATEQQLHLADVVVERDFFVTLDVGTISFGDDLTYRCELIGTESPASGTWLWGWANPAEFDDHITATTRALRAHGEAQGIAALSEAEVPLDDEVSGHRMAAIAVGHAQGPAYFSAPMDGGARAYLLVDDPRLELPAPEVPRLMTTLTLILENGDVRNWPAALGSYADRRELTATDEHGAIRLEGPTLDGHVRVALDELGRIAELTGSAGGGEAVDGEDHPDDGGDKGSAPERRGLLGRLRRR